MAPALCLANVESRDRRGFIQLPNPVCLHGARFGLKANHVDINVFRVKVVATFGSIEGTQSTLEEELSSGR